MCSRDASPAVKQVWPAVPPTDRPKAEGGMSAPALAIRFTGEVEELGQHKLTQKEYDRAWQELREGSPADFNTVSRMLREFPRHTQNDLSPAEILSYVPCVKSVSQKAKERKPIYEQAIKEIKPEQVKERFYETCTEVARIISRALTPDEVSSLFFPGSEHLLDLIRLRGEIPAPEELALFAQISSATSYTCCLETLHGYWLCSKPIHREDSMPVSIDDTAEAFGMLTEFSRLEPDGLSVEKLRSCASVIVEKAEAHRPEEAQNGGIISSPGSCAFKACEALAKGLKRALTVEEIEARLASLYGMSSGYRSLFFDALQEMVGESSVPFDYKLALLDRIVAEKGNPSKFIGINALIEQRGEVLTPEDADALIASTTLQEFFWFDYSKLDDAASQVGLEGTPLTLEMLKTMRDLFQACYLYYPEPFASLRIYADSRGEPLTLPELKHLVPVVQAPGTRESVAQLIEIEKQRGRTSTLQELGEIADVARAVGDTEEAGNFKRQILQRIGSQEQETGRAVSSEAMKNLAQALNLSRAEHNQSPIINADNIISELERKKGGLLDLEELTVLAANLGDSRLYNLKRTLDKLSVKCAPKAWQKALRFIGLGTKEETAVDLIWGALDSAQEQNSRPLTFAERIQVMLSSIDHAWQIKCGENADDLLKLIEGARWPEAGHSQE